MAINPSPTASSTPQPLSFPALTFAKLSPHAFLHAHLTSSAGPTRPSHRTPSESRRPTVHTGSLTHANGSAVVRIGDTAAVCGVRAEILCVKDVADYQPPRREVQESTDGNTGDKHAAKKRKLREDSAEMASLNLLVPNLELATGCSPAHMPGGPPSTLAQTLSQRLLTLMHTSRLVDIDELRIWYHPPKINPPDKMEEDDVDEEDTKPSIKAFWTLYIDILFISLDGNPFDAAWGAMLAALQDVRLPKSWWDADKEVVLCDDDASMSKPLTLSRVPIAATFAVFADDRTGAKWILADPDAFEESICKETITVVVQKQIQKPVWNVVAIEKTGGLGVGVKDMRQLVEMAQKRWKDWSEVLSNHGGAPKKQSGSNGEMSEKARIKAETEERVRIKMEKLGLPPLKSIKT